MSIQPTHKGSRLFALDLARLMAMLMMMQGHTLDALVNPQLMDLGTFPWNIWQFMRGLTAPIFLIVSGTVHVFAMKRDEQGAMSEETRKRLSESATASNLKRWSNLENRLKQSQTMREVAKNNPEAYSSSNRGRVKQIEYDGIKFQGKWELDFYLWCINNDVQCIRNIKGFPYSWNGDRTYFPDFFLPEKNVYVEVKGYKTDRDEAKWKQFSEHLLIVDQMSGT